MHNSPITLVGQSSFLKHRAEPLFLHHIAQPQKLRNKPQTGGGVALLDLIYLELNFIWKNHFFEMDSVLFQIQELKG